MDRKTRRAMRTERFRKLQEALKRPPAGFEDHRPPVTRRDFMAHGLLGSMTFLTGPTLLEHLFASKAKAEGFQCAPKSTWYFVVNAPGGPGILQNFTCVAGTATGALPSSAGLLYSGVNPAPGVADRISTMWGAKVQMTDLGDTQLPNPFIASLRESLPADRIAAMNICAAHTTVRSDNGDTSIGTLTNALRTYLALRDTTYITGGLGINLGASVKELTTGIEAYSQDLLVDAPYYFTRVTSVNSIRQVLSTPVGNLSTVEADNAAMNKAFLRAREAFMERMIANGKTSGRLRERAEAFRLANATADKNIDAFTGQMARLDPATTLAPATRAILDALRAYRGATGDTRDGVQGGPAVDLTGINTRDANLLASALAAVRCNVASRLITIAIDDGDHHINTNPRYRSFGHRVGKLIAAFVAEAHANNANAVVLSVHDGSMYGAPERTVTINNQQFNVPLGTPPADADSLAVGMMMFFPATGGQRPLQRAELGFADEQGRHQPSIVGTDTDMAYALLYNAIHADDPSGAAEAFRRIVNPNRFSHALIDQVRFFA